MDRETGLVWERTTGQNDFFRDAEYECMFRVTGGRKGWRLPSIHELASLFVADPGVHLPDGPSLSHRRFILLVGDEGGVWDG